MNYKGISIGNLIEGMFNVVFKNIKELIKPLGIIALMGVVIAIPQEFINPYNPSIILSLITAIIGFLSLFLIPIVTGALIKMLYDAYKGNPISFDESMKIAKEKALTLIGVEFLVILVFGLPIIIILGILIGIFIACMNTMGIGAILLFIGLFLALLVGVFIIGIFFSFYQVGIMVKDLKAWESIKYSFRLFKGKFGALFGRLVLINLLIGAIGSAISMIAIIPIVGVIVISVISVLTTTLSLVASIILVDAYDPEFNNENIEY